MCTVLVRFDPTAVWPVLLAAVRDEFVERPWDPPGPHWPQLSPTLTGGRDRTAGGTWLAVRRSPPAVAAVLNGRPLPAPARPRPSRGRLPLAALAEGTPDADELRAYDAFHLLVATPDAVTMWSWDGDEVRRRYLTPGDHIAVNLGWTQWTIRSSRTSPRCWPLRRRRRWTPMWTPSLPGPAGSNCCAVTAWPATIRGPCSSARSTRGEVTGRPRPASWPSAGRASRMDFTATPTTPDWRQIPVP